MTIAKMETVLTEEAAREMASSLKDLFPHCRFEARHEYPTDRKFGWALAYTAYSHEDAACIQYFICGWEAGRRCLRREEDAELALLKCHPSPVARKMQPERL